MSSLNLSTDQKCNFITSPNNDPQNETTNQILLDHSQQFNNLFVNTLGLIPHKDMNNVFYTGHDNELEVIVKSVDTEKMKNFMLTHGLHICYAFEQYKKAANSNNIYAIYGCATLYSIESCGMDPEYTRQISELYQAIYDHAVENYNNGISNEKVIISYLNHILSQDYKNDDFLNHVAYLCIRTLTSNCTDTEISDFIKSFANSGNINAIALQIQLCYDKEEELKYLKIAADIDDTKIDNSTYILKYAKHMSNILKCTKYVTNDNDYVKYTLKYFKVQIAKIENNENIENNEIPVPGHLFYDYANFICKWRTNTEDEAIKYYKKSAELLYIPSIRECYFLLGNEFDYTIYFEKALEACRENKITIYGINHRTYDNHNMRYYKPDFIENQNNDDQCYNTEKIYKIYEKYITNEYIDISKDWNNKLIHVNKDDYYE